jgi:hypothetical protein
MGGKFALAPNALRSVEFIGGAREGICILSASPIDLSRGRKGERIR